MRLAYLSLETPRPGQASYTHIHEIVAELRKIGWNVDLFATTEGGASAHTAWSKRLRGYFRIQFRLALRLRGYDALFIRAHFMAVPIAVLARLAKIPVFQEINGPPDDVVVTYSSLRHTLFLLNSLYRVQMRGAAHLFAVTDGLAGWCKSFAGHDRVSVVPNGANISIFCPEGATWTPGYRYVVFVGGLVAWHGIGTMLAATESAAWPDDLRLVLVGDGPERYRIEDCVGERVVWLGRVAYDEVPALLRGALAAMCLIENPGGRSATGVAPLKLYEAMACGTPVIVSDLPYQGDLVQNNAVGAVIPAGDPEALSLILSQALEDTARLRTWGENGARYVQSEASWANRAQHVSAVMSACLGPARLLAADPDSA